MTLLVDAMPLEPDDCIFMELWRVVDEDVLEKAARCEDCGGFILDEEEYETTCGCSLVGSRCTLASDGVCDRLSTGYVTKF